MKIHKKDKLCTIEPATNVHIAKNAGLKFQTGVRIKLVFDQKPTEERVPCLVISFSPSQTARPLLASVNDS